MTQTTDTKRLRPKTPNGRTVYRESRFALRVCAPSATGPLTQRGVIVHPGSVVIIPIMPSGEIVMIQNQRWQIGESILELTAGTLEPPEPPIECARRELIEETGYQCDSLTLLHQFYALPGLTNEVMHVYVARGLIHVGQSLQPDEEIEVQLMTPQAVKDAIMNGTIIDGKTLAVLGLYFLSDASC